MESKIIFLLIVRSMLDRNYEDVVIMVEKGWGSEYGREKSKATFSSSLSEIVDLGEELEPKPASSES